MANHTFALNPKRILQLMQVTVGYLIVGVTVQGCMPANGVPVSEWMAGIPSNEIEYGKIRVEDRKNSSQLDK